MQYVTNDIEKHFKVKYSNFKVFFIFQNTIKI